MPFMISHSGSPDNKKDDSRSEWIEKAIVHEKELRTYAEHTFKTHKTKENNRLSTDKNKIEEWGRRCSKFVETSYYDTETEGDNKEDSRQICDCNVDNGRSLISALALSKRGYIICSLVAILEIIKKENLSRKDRLEACVLVLENIAMYK